MSANSKRWTSGRDDRTLEFVHVEVVLTASDGNGLVVARNTIDNLVQCQNQFKRQSLRSNLT
jgi:hypothetical protein